MLKKIQLLLERLLQGFLLLDDAIVSILERKLFHPVQRWTGKTNYYVAARCMVGVSMVIAYGAIEVAATDRVGSRVSIALSTTFSLVMGFVVFKTGNDLANRAEQRLAEGEEAVANAERISLIGVCTRWAMVFLSVACTYGYAMKRIPTIILVLAWANCFVSWALACTPLPPGKSKIRELLDVWFASRRSATSEA